MTSNNNPSRRKPLTQARAYMNIVLGLVITVVAIIGLFHTQLNIQVNFSNSNLLYFYCAIALLYGPFRIWRGVTDLQGDSQKRN